MEMFLVAAVFGIVIGALSGLLGIGGGVIMVPLFRLVFGMNPIVATATSLFTIIPTSLSGMSKHVRNKTCVVRVGVVCGLAGACLSPVGVIAAAASPAWLVMAAAASVVAYSAFTMVKKAIVAPKAPKSSSGKRAAAGKSAGGASAEASRVTTEGDAPTASATSGTSSPAASAEDGTYAPPSFTFAFVAKVVAIGVVAGFMSGYVGVGGGFIMVPLFMALLGVPMRLASGTSLLAVCILAVPGAIEQGVLGNIDYLVGIATAVGSIPGAFLGASLVKHVPERTLRFVFAAFLLVSAVALVFNEFGVV
ncbi:MAG: sulfite exporter TauE/SafE family protein [Slackia sp.]|nr:sulfite exporter TauE/SafE family protein [Slackia sp.]